MWPNQLRIFLVSISEVMYELINNYDDDNYDDDGNNYTAPRMASCVHCTRYSIIIKSSTHLTFDMLHSFLLPLLLMFLDYKLYFYIQ